jgi:hypothetical protein
MLMLGTREANSFEPFEAISDWLLGCPDTDCLFSEPDSSMVGFVAQYQL